MPVFTLAIIMLIFGVSAPLHAAKFHCSSGDVTCLIAAINKANHTGGPHTIFLDPGTYALTLVDNDTDGPNGLPSIKNKMTIESDPPHSVTIERDPASENFRPFHVSPGGELELRFLRLQDGVVPLGEVGGTLFNRGTATLFGVVVRENVLAGENDMITNAGNLVIFQSSIEDSSVPGHSGLISNSGDAKIVESSIKGNAHIIAPIIRNKVDSAFGSLHLPPGTLVIQNSSIIENQSDSPTIYNPGGTLTLTNTTVGNNLRRVGGGGAVATNSGGVTSLLNSTISRNTAEFNVTSGLVNIDGTVNVKNSIIALNKRGIAGTPANCAGEITSLGNNLIGDTTTLFPPCVITLQPTDLTGDPRLGALADNGDPGNGHFPLLSDSPAIGSGDSGACPKADQLGFFRVATCDMGAVEFQPGPLGIVLDFQPHDPKNTINLHSRGDIDVAILGSASFDARAIDPETVRFGPNQASSNDRKDHLRDVNGDGFDDLILRFSVADSGIQCGDKNVVISGETFNGQAIQGSDFIQTIGC